MANSLIGLQGLVKIVQRISSPTEPFPSTASSVSPDTSRMEKDLIAVSSCQHQVQALLHYTIFVNMNMKYIYHNRMVSYAEQIEIFILYSLLCISVNNCITQILSKLL